MCRKIALAILVLSLTACATFTEKKDQTESLEPALNPQAEPVVAVAEKPPKETTEKTEATQSSIVKTQEADVPATKTPQSVGVAPTITASLVPTQTTVDASQASEKHAIDGQLALSLHLPYAQARVKIEKVLPEIGYPVMEQDSTSGTYYILDKAGSGGTIKRDTPIYQLHLHQADINQTTITINNAQNQPLTHSVVERIFNALKNKLAL